MEIKAGQIVAITGGQYSDYCLRDHVKALKTFETEIVVKEYFNHIGRPNCHYTEPEFRKWVAKRKAEAPELYCIEEFIVFLMRQGYVTTFEENEVVEWHCNDV